MDVAAGQNGVGGLRYASEETVAELTKEEKVSCHAWTRAEIMVRLEQRLIPVHRGLSFA